MINPAKVVEEATSLPDHPQKPTPRAVVFCVGFEMCGQTLDLLSQERNLYFGGSGISLMYSELLNGFVFTSRFRHAQPFFSLFCLAFP